MFHIGPWKKQRDGNQALTTAEHPMNRLRAEFDSLFDRFFGLAPGFWGSEWTPFANWGLEMQDTDKALAIRAEAPGFEAEDFDVQVSGNLLTIRAERKEESGEKEEGQSFSRRRLQRSVTLPTGVVPDKVEARYRNGILELVLPKTPEAQGRRIEVKKA